MNRKSINYSAQNSNAKTKTELAEDLGIPIPQSGYWGNMTSKVCGTVGGAIGGNIIKNAVEQFEKTLIKKDK